FRASKTTLTRSGYVERNFVAADHDLKRSQDCYPVKSIRRALKAPSTFAAYRNARLLIERAETESKHIRESPRNELRVTINIDPHGNANGILSCSAQRRRNNVEITYGVMGAICIAKCASGFSRVADGRKRLACDEVVLGVAVACKHVVEPARIQEWRQTH